MGVMDTEMVPVSELLSVAETAEFMVEQHGEMAMVEALRMLEVVHLRGRYRMTVFFAQILGELKQKEQYFLEPPVEGALTPMETAEILVACRGLEGARSWVRLAVEKFVAEPTSFLSERPEHWFATLDCIEVVKPRAEKLSNICN